MFLFDRDHFARQNDFRVQRIPDFSSLQGKRKLIRETDGKNVFHNKRETTVVSKIREILGAREIGIPLH